MKSYVYEIDENLDTLINLQTKKEINSSKSILIQLFSGKDAKTVRKILKDLHHDFPQAVIITSSTDGEIIQSKITTNSTVLTISTFEETTLKIAYSDEDDSFNAGEYLAKELTTENTKLIITFADGLLHNGEEFLEGIHSINQKSIISGGLAGDNAQFQQCHVGMNETLYDKGAVGVSFNSDTLIINNFYNFGWNAIGIKHKITKAVKNRLYTIDNISAVDFYRKYLGDSIANKLPHTGIEFPLIMYSDGLKKARAVTAKHDDGSLSFAGNLIEGEYVYMGVGEVQTIVSNPISNMYDVAVESFFIYSCMARRRFIPDLIHQEIEPFATIAPTSGFFTYGEFFTHSKPELLNQTLTAVALSESKEAIPKQKAEARDTTHDTTYKALMHIIEVTSKELHEQTILQEKINNELVAKTNILELIQEMSNLANWEIDLKTKQTYWSKKNYEIYNIPIDEEPPSYLEYLNMIMPEDRKKFLDFQNDLNDYKTHSVELSLKRNDNKIIHIIRTAKLIKENGEASKIIGTTLDITDIRMKDTILMQQSKSAQMGEMINMIAHQWRQPLNAISSASIKLNMQSSMDLLTNEEVEKTSKFIEEMTQKMSQTINDFMNFTKPNNQKELIDFETILEEILKIIGPQLQNQNIVLESEIQKDLQFYTYKKELEHILMNIISNARDALVALDDIEKYIKIKVYSEQNLCIIKIADNAGGIDENIIDRIFDPYFTTKETKKGTGLGLYMSRKLLKEHLNGNIFVCNKDSGAEFTIILEQSVEDE